MTDRELMQQALKALRTRTTIGHEAWQACEDAITALRERLAQPEQEPIAWMVYTLDGKSVYVTDNPADFTPEHRALPLYTAPPRRESVGLSDDEVDELAREMVKGDKSVNWLARAIEAKLREKNGGEV